MIRWPWSKKPAPELDQLAKVAEKARAEKRSAVSELLDALREIEIERDISDAVGSRGKKVKP